MKMANTNKSSEQEYLETISVQDYNCETYMIVLIMTWFGRDSWPYQC